MYNLWWVRDFSSPVHYGLSSLENLHHKKRLEWSHQLPFSSHITNSEQDICQKLPFVAKSYHVLPKVTICCQKFPFIAKSFHLLPKVTICCQKLPFVAKSYHVLPKVSICCQMLPFVAKYHEKPSKNTKNACAEITMGDILSQETYCPGSVRRHFVPGDILSRFCKATFCPGRRIVPVGNKW